MTRACILSVAGAELSAAERALFSDVDPWGVILMGRSCQTKEQVRTLVADIQEATGRKTLIFIDQEGGRVARLKAPEWPLFPTGMNYAAVHGRDREAGERAVRLGHRLIGSELAQLGIFADCAPVVDIPIAGAHDVIGDRALGGNPVDVGELAQAALDGLQDAGVVGVIKHIPGHGRSMADSHVELPKVTASREELEADFEAFAKVSAAPMAMTAHISYEAIEPGVAATLSAKLISEIIRGRIGFGGLLMSDDLGMNALGGSLTARADKAIIAGCDMLLHCSGFLKEPDAILREMTEVGHAAPILAGLAKERAEAVDALAGKATPLDLVADREEFTRLMSMVGVSV